MSAERLFAKEVSIGPAIIRDGVCFVIAEAGINHNGDILLAKKLIDAAIFAGADAVKFQTFIASEEATKKTQKADYQKTSGIDNEPYMEMIKKFEFDEEEWREIIRYCAEKNIIFLSTPSEEASARMLQRLGVPAFKIASNDLVTIPMLEEIASWGKPIILSTGMADLDEIQEALDALAKAGNTNIILLHCVSMYPTPPENLNMRVIKTLKNRFGCLVGFSDHSSGTQAAVLAVLLGAVVIETHITLDKRLPGPDQKMALEPGEFAAMVKTIRRVQSLDADGKQAAIAAIPEAELILGSFEKRPSVAELEMRNATRKSIVARRDIPKGKTIDQGDLAFKRPLGGLPPREHCRILGKRATVPIAKDEYIVEGYLA